MTQLAQSTDTIAVPSAPPATCPKSPDAHLLVSLFLPGVGTMMNGEMRTGAVLVAGFVTSSLISLVALVYVATTFVAVIAPGHVALWLVPYVLGRHLATGALAPTLVGPLGAMTFWIAGMASAYTGAQAWNARHGIVS